MADPRQDLEDYASGIGAGAYSPQQGSGLPVSAQGGLPMGSQPLPQPTPGPTATFQRAPVTSIGQQSPVDAGEILQQRLQAIAAYNPQTATWDQQNQNYLAMKDLPALAQVASIKSQDRQLQASHLKAIQDSLKEYSSKTPEEQAGQRPMMEKLLTAYSQLAGLQASPQDIQHTLKSPDISRAYADVLGEDYTTQERESNLARLSGVSHDKREGVLKEILTKKEQSLLSEVQREMPQAIMQLGGSAKAPIDQAQFMAKVSEMYGIKKGSMVERVANLFMNDPKNAETLAGWGLRTGKTAQVEQEAIAKEQAKGPESSTGVKDVLGGWRGPDGLPLTPATAAKLPPGSKVTDGSGKPLPVQDGASALELARKIVKSDALQYAAQQGFNAVLAKADAERKIPLAQVPEFRNMMFVNKETEQQVDRISTNLDTLAKSGGESKFAVLDEKKAAAFNAAKQTEMMLGQYLDVVKTFTNKPGANIGQALTFYGKTYMGIENPGRVLAALRGQILQMAKAQQGSAQSLSNLDAKSVEGMLPNEWDSIQTGLQALEISAKLTRNSKLVQLGKYAPDTLLADIDKAKMDLARSRGIDVYENTEGVRIPIPKGQSHPGKGWKKVE